MSEEQKSEASEECPTCTSRIKSVGQECPTHMGQVKGVGQVVCEKGVGLRLSIPPSRVSAKIKTEPAGSLQAATSDGVTFLAVEGVAFRDGSRLMAKMKIGVLALQGDFDAHRRRLQELGAEVVLVKKPEQLDEIDGLVIPGGESSAILKLLGEAGFQKLRDFVRSKPSFGTCAGAILLAREVENPAQSGLGAIDIGIRRNAYGRQIDSSIREGRFRGSPIEVVFIRAPKISRLGPGVEVLATQGDDAVVVRQGTTMAATFHPELTGDPRIHETFLQLVQNANKPL